jgi:hypothetical protein
MGTASRAGAGLVGQHLNHGVQNRVHCIDASQMRIAPAPKGDPVLHQF